MNKKFMFIFVLAMFALASFLPQSQAKADVEFIQIISPNGGETYYTGEVNHITWTASPEINMVSIDYSTCDGCLVSIAAFVPNTGSYDWDLSAMGNVNTQFKIVITGYDSINLITVSDTSDAYFTVQPRPSPSAISPLGSVVTPTPVFIWSDTGSPVYNFAVLNKNMSNIFSATVTPSCDGQVCTYTLPLALSPNIYNWYVVNPDQFLYDIKRFAINGPDFSSAFDKNHFGWKPLQGIGKTSKGKYETIIKDNKWVSLEHSNTYAVGDYKVKMRRVGGCVYCANSVIVGQGKPFRAGFWNRGYLLSYTNTGYASIYKIQNGKAQALKKWSKVRTIDKNNMNTVRIVGYGSSIYFYINGKLIWQNTGNFELGHLGIAMFGPGIFQVDSASLKGFQSFPKLKSDLPAISPNYDFLNLNEIGIAPN